MNILAELENILAQEQSILLEGDYAKLGDLADKKTWLAEKLAESASGLPGEAVKKLAHQAAHNEALLASARRGIQSAISQLKEYSTGEHQSTYSAEGQREPLSRRVSVTQKY